MKKNINSEMIKIFTCVLMLLQLTLYIYPSDTDKYDKLTGADNAWLAKIQKDISSQEYNISRLDTSCTTGIMADWQAPNRAHGLRTYFTEAGPRVIQRTAESSEWVWGLEMINAPKTLEIKTNGNRIEFHRDNGVVEWYVNNEKGLEQGFTLTHADKQITSREIKIDLVIHGDLSAGMMPGGKTIEFLSSGGVGIIHYGGLSVIDAEGKNLPSQMELAEKAGKKAIRITADLTGAKYPVTIDPLVTSAAWTAESNQASAYFGNSVASAGDVNGDGYNDVIIGAHYFDGGQTNEGKVFVYYGSSSGLSASASWTAEGNQADAQFGYAVGTAGDVNNDGCSDIIIGAHYYDNGQTDEGRAFVYYGSTTGLPGGPDWTAESDQASASFGVCAGTAGDVNGDGYSDVIIGAYRYDNPESDEGRVYVYYGSASGLSAAPNWTGEGEQAGAYYGYSAGTAGDINNDGFSDIIVGAYNYDNGQSNEGYVFVYFGSSGGLSSVPGWTAESDQSDSRFGASVSTAGDVNGDGCCDIIIGANYYDNTESNEGCAFVYHGSLSGLSLTPNWIGEYNTAMSSFGISVCTAGDVNGDGYGDVIIGAENYTNGNSNEGGAFLYLGSETGLGSAPAWIGEGNQTNAHYGKCVALAGDVNGDGYSDVIVGADDYDGGQTDEGRAFVYYGTASSLSAAPFQSFEGDQSNANFAYSAAAAGDINGDGFADVIVGALYYDSGETNEGKAFVYTGSAEGLSTEAVWTAEGNQTEAWFGCSVASAGDVNGDGYSDVIVGSYSYDNGKTDEGAAFVYYGSPLGLSANADWTAESDQANAWFGYSVASAGDVNGDGFSDVIIGAYLYDKGQTDEGGAFVYHGSSTGLSSAPDRIAESNQAAAHFGYSVASAGDINRDGFSDIIVGAFDYDGGQTDEGRAYVFHGSGSGISATANWIAESNQAESNFGRSVSGAGDVNGDGYSDIIVGAPYYSSGQTGEGRAFVYHGSASGLSGTANWTGESNQWNANFGYSVSNAGDINNDSYSDIVIGAPNYSNVESGEGRAFVYHGSESGLSSTSKWTGEINQTYANYGNSVSCAGDINGDGFSDVIIGARFYDNGNSDEGGVFAYYGNGEAGKGMSRHPQLLRSDKSTPVHFLGNTLLPVEIKMQGRNLNGRGKIKLEYEIKPFGVPFDGIGTVKSASWTDTPTTSTLLEESVNGVYGGAKHWRARVKYHPVTSPQQSNGPWFSNYGNSAQEKDFILLSFPKNPDNPGATSITANSITWKWNDNSDNESGFKIYTDAGTGLPATQRTVTGANATSWQQSGLTPNTIYSMQAAATNIYGDSAKTTNYSARTYAAVPAAPVVNNPQLTTLDIAIASGDGNTTDTQYFIYCTTNGKYLQADGTLGISAIWQTASEWGTKRITGLNEATTYTFRARARNALNIETSDSPSASGTTLCRLTVTSPYGSPSPTVGTKTYSPGTVINASVGSPVSDAPGIKYFCTGYTGTGSIISGSGNSCSFTIMQSSSLTWIWKMQYQLTTDSVPAGAGFTTPSTEACFDPDTTVTLLANQNPGWYFTHWSGDLSGSENPKDIFMNSGKSITANFIPELTIISEHGSSIPEDGTTTYTIGTVINASVESPISGGPGIQYVCTGYTGTGDVPNGTGTSCSFSITQPGSLTWHWTTQYQLTTESYPPSAGTTTPAEPVWINAGETAGISAAPNAGWTFSHWSGDLSGSANPENIIMDSPKIIQSNFNPVLQVFSDHGNPTPATGSTSYTSGTLVIASVNSPAGGENGIRFICTGFTGTGDVPSDTGTSCTIIMTQPSTLTWNWKTQYQLMISENAVGAGSVSPESGTWHDADSTVTLLAVPASLWQFGKWTGDINSSANPQNVFINSEKNITANFNPQLEIISAHGNPSPAGITYPEFGTTVNASVESVVIEQGWIRYICTGCTGTGDIPSESGVTNSSFIVTQPSSLTWEWEKESVTGFYLH